MKLIKVKKKVDSKIKKKDYLQDFGARKKLTDMLEKECHDIEDNLRENLQKIFRIYQFKGQLHPSDARTIALIIDRIADRNQTLQKNYEKVSKEFNAL